MQLVMRRSQSKGVLGGVSFEVHAQVRLSEEERALLKQYKQEAVVVLQRPLYLFGQPLENRVVNITAGQLVNGESFKCKDLAEVIAYGDNVRRACENLYGYLQVAKTFGGEEIIEIAAPGSGERDDA
jgi:hypothetical protein